jgi:hypothetical protein
MQNSSARNAVRVEDVALVAGSDVGMPRYLKVETSPGGPFKLMIVPGSAPLPTEGRRRPRRRVRGMR